MITIAGNRGIHKLVWHYIRGVFNENIKIVVIDGANVFDPYLISKISVRMNFSPYTLLEDIFVARAFTPFQMIELLKKVYNFSRSDKKFLFLFLGLTHLLDDENISYVKSMKILKKSLDYLEKIDGSIVTVDKTDRRNMLESVEKRSRVFIMDNSIIKPLHMRKGVEKIWEGQLHLLRTS